MKLSQLLSLYSQLNWGDFPTSDVGGLCADSRLFKSGDVFVAVRGYSFDGHKFVAEACNGGALAVVVEDDSNVPTDFKGAVVVTEDTKVALQQLANRFNDYPAQDMFCVGVTGTNGKTSTSYMIECVLSHFGWKTGVLGTVDHHILNHKWESQLTTPDALTLFKRLKEFNSLEAKAVAFEVSSHALEQKRADEIPFNAAVFTNLTRDHLDYHGDMESYFHAKEKLFNELLWKSKSRQPFAIINFDDDYGRKIKVYEGAKIWSYGQENSDFEISNIRQNFTGVHFQLTTPRDSGQVYLPMIGEHNVYNATAAIAVGMAAGASFESSVEALKGFNGVPGRLQNVANEKGLHVFVDYAHTDDALINVLNSLNEIKQQAAHKHRIITVFGCGGDRDKGKRPMMMRAALKGSDFVMLTSDNPRTEDPEQIIKDCLTGAENTSDQQRVQVEVNRRRALEKVLSFAQKDDVILVAGKGHEDYQIIGTEKMPFSDMEILKEILSGL